MLRKAIYPILCLSLFSLAACQKPAPQQPEQKSAAAKKLGSTTLRVNFHGDIAQKKLSWLVDDTLVSSNKRAAVALSRTQHQLTVDFDGQKNNFQLDAGTDLPLFVEFEERDGRVASVFAKDKPALSNLVIKSEPTGAYVFINRRPYGNTPVSVGLFSADQEVEVILTRPGYRMSQQKVTINSDKFNKVVMTMKALEEGESPMNSALPKPISSISIDAPDSPGSKVLINNIDIKRVTPIEKLDLPIGQYNVTIVRADGSSFTFQAELEEGHETVIKENLVGREVPSGKKPGVLEHSPIVDGPAAPEHEGHHHHGH